MSLSSARTSLSFRPQQFSGLFSTWIKNYIGYLDTLKDKKVFRVFIKYPCATLRRSPFEQYSMASSGRSFIAMELNSAGTSLAWTTFTWFSLHIKSTKLAVTVENNTMYSEISSNNTLSVQTDNYCSLLHDLNLSRPAVFVLRVQLQSAKFHSNLLSWLLLWTHTGS